MSKGLRGFSDRKAKLALLAALDRQAIADSGIWRSVAFLAADLALVSARAAVAGYLIRRLVRRGTARPAFPTNHRK
jgi:alanyl-tRNA synthetase